LFRHTLTWRDVGYRERLTVLASQEGSTDTVDLLRVLSNAVLSTACDGLVVATNAVSPNGDTYPDLDDTWIVTAEDAGSYRTQIYIPSALVAGAIADGVNYAAVSTEWIDFETALPALAVPYTGASCNAIVAGTIARAAERIHQPYFGYSDSITWARRSLLWYGVHGRSRLTHLTGDVASLGGDFDLMMAAMQTLSAAVVTHYWEDEMAVYDDAPTTDLYNSVNDACQIWFQDADGNMTEVTLPAPNIAIFLPDGKTLDVEQANVASFIDSAIAQLVVPISGLPVTACVGGHLTKRSVY